MAARTKTTDKVHSKEHLRELIQEATVDCYDEHEETMGMHAMLEEHLAIPFETEVLGIPVTVEAILHLRTREVVAICRSGKHRQAISLAELPLPVKLEGAEWIAAYRHWVSTF